MLKLKKFTCIIIAVTMLALTACGSKDTDSSSKATEPMPESVADTSSTDSTDTESKEETTTTTTTAAEPVVTEPEVSEPDEEPVGEVIKITYKEVLDTIVEYFDPDHLDQTEAALLEKLPLDPDTKVDYCDTKDKWDHNATYGWANNYNFKKNVVLISEDGTEIEGADIGYIQVWDGHCVKNDRNTGKSTIRVVRWDIRYTQDYDGPRYTAADVLSPLDSSYGEPVDYKYKLPNNITIEFTTPMSQYIDEMFFEVKKTS